MNVLFVNSRLQFFVYAHLNCAKPNHYCFRIDCTMHDKSIISNQFGHYFDDTYVHIDVWHSYSAKYYPVSNGYVECNRIRNERRTTQCNPMHSQCATFEELYRIWSHTHKHTHTTIRKTPIHKEKAATKSTTQSPTPSERLCAKRVHHSPHCGRSTLKSCAHLHPNDWISLSL